eukprot:3137392-Rhodomonas_salina.2
MLLFSAATLHAAIYGSKSAACAGTHGHSAEFFWGGAQGFSKCRRRSFEGSAVALPTSGSLQTAHCRPYSESQYIANAAARTDAGVWAYQRLS